MGHSLLAIALLLLPTVAVSRPGVETEHDPGCVAAYSNWTFTPDYRQVQGPGSLADDLHLAITTDAPLCAFTIRWISTLPGLPGSVKIQFRSGGAGDPVPGVVTAGPFDLDFVGDPNPQEAHVEVNSGYVTPDAYIEVIWETDLNGFYVMLADAASVGSSHDTWYQLPFAIFDDNGEFPASFAVEVFVSPQVPVHNSTWGSLKSTYR